MRQKIQNSLLKQADTMNSLLTTFNPTVEREGMKDWENKNPFGNKGNVEDQIAVAPTPQGPKSEPERTPKEERWVREIGMKSSLLKSAEPHATYLESYDKPEREDLRDRKDRETKKEDSDKFDDSLTPQERIDKSTKSKMSSLSVFAKLQPTFEIYEQYMLVKIPKMARQISLSPKNINQMENQISKVLNVRAKYDHVSVSPQFDGISLEFLLC